MSEMLQIWLAKQTLSSKLCQTIYGSFHMHNGLLLMGDRIVVPKSMQKETLSKICSGYQGIQRCQLHVRQSAWWPGISRYIKAEVKECRECSRHASKPREPMTISEIPKYPWQKVGSDLFKVKGHTCLVLVDYFFAIYGSCQTVFYHFIQYSSCAKVCLL